MLQNVPLHCMKGHYCPVPSGFQEEAHHEVSCYAYLPSLDPKPDFQEEIRQVQFLLMTSNKVQFQCSTIRNLVSPVLDLLLPRKLSALTWVQDMSSQRALQGQRKMGTLEWKAQ